MSPIIIFAYNRPHYLKKTLEALSNNSEAKQSTLYIYCDGPKSNASKKTLLLIREVRDFARTQQWCKYTYIIESDVNKGLAKSIILGVTEIVNKYGSVIVLEDDIVVAPHFLKYMNDALKLYENEDKIASISGYNFPIDSSLNNKETFFIKSITSWGWATWSRAWLLYDDDAAKLLGQIKKSQINEFDFDKTRRFVKMLKDTISGRVDSWAIRWYASCFLNDKLSLFPMKSMIQNVGMLGTHVVGDNRDFIGVDYFKGEIKDFEQIVVQNQDLRELWKKHFVKHNRRKLTYHNMLYIISKLRMALWNKH